MIYCGKGCGFVDKLQGIMMDVSRKCPHRRMFRVKSGCGKIVEKRWENTREMVETGQETAPFLLPASRD